MVSTPVAVFEIRIPTQSDVQQPLTTCIGASCILLVLLVFFCFLISALEKNERWKYLHRSQQSYGFGYMFRALSRQLREKRTQPRLTNILSARGDGTWEAAFAERRPNTTRLFLLDTESVRTPARWILPAQMGTAPVLGSAYAHHGDSNI